MAKDNNEPKNVDIFIVDSINESKDKAEKEVKNLLRIPVSGQTEDFAIRVFDKGNSQQLYRSTRIRTIESDQDGYFTDVTGKTKELVGCRYEVTEQGTKKILLKGKIAVKKAEANVVDLGKTGS